MAALRLTFLITDLYIGGSPLILRDLASGLQASGGGGDFDIRIISLKPLPPENQSAFGPSQLPITNDQLPSVPEQLRTSSLNLTAPWQLFRARRDLLILLRQNPPDILYSILIHANLLAALTVPHLVPRPFLIQSIHTLQPRPRWHWSIQRFLAPRADLIIAPSQPILDRIARFGRIRQGLVIPNGIDVERFARAQPLPIDQRPWPAPPHARILGYVGRFDPVKRLDLLLYALKYLNMSMGEKLENAGELGEPQTDAAGETEGASTGRAPGAPPSARGMLTGASRAPRGRVAGGAHGEFAPWHLALVGYGPDEKRLRELTISLHLTPFVHFLGPTRTPEQFYKSFNCLCLPSSVEGFGLILAEALAAGIPVVAPKTAVTEALISDPLLGRLVPDPTPESLAQAIQEVTANPPAPESLQTHIRTHFSTTLMVTRHAEILKKIKKITV